MTAWPLRPTPSSRPSACAWACVHAHAETHTTHGRARISTALHFSQPWRQSELSKTQPPLNVLVTNAIQRAVASAAVQQTPEAHAATVALAADGLSALIALATEGKWPHVHVLTPDIVRAAY